MVNAYTYSMSVEYIELEMEEGQEYYEDGKRYVTCDASELSDSGELLVYLPGARMDDLPEAFISWTTYGDFGVERDFRCYGIYNQIQELAFIGSRYISYEDLQKLDGTFRNEAGDEFVIDIYQESEDLSDASGDVSFIPQSGEMRSGHVYRIAAGGFEIALPESEVYYFDIVDDDMGCTQFVGNEMYSAELGIFTKVQ